uniref:FHA domain-containing protein n=1 Tax=Ditylenchus dipsaci TaxID=166011 RepID=A0A915DJ88_9BILA
MGRENDSKRRNEDARRQERQIPFSKIEKISPRRCEPFERDNDRPGPRRDNRDRNNRDTSPNFPKDKMGRGMKREWKSPEKWDKSSSKFKTESDEEKPSFEPSGKLAADTNTYKGVVIKYNEPPEAKLPKIRWRLYPFRVWEESMPVIYVHRQSAYLIGRDRKIADFPIDHPSCSKQHAALQYRSMPYVRGDGTHSRRTRPYIIDLKSGNGTYLNGQRIEAQSTREFVVLNEIHWMERMTRTQKKKKGWTLILLVQKRN